MEQVRHRILARYGTYGGRRHTGFVGKPLVMVSPRDAEGIPIARNLKQGSRPLDRATCDFSHASPLRGEAFDIVHERLYEPRVHCFISSPTKANRRVVGRRFRRLMCAGGGRRGCGGIILTISRLTTDGAPAAAATMREAPPAVHPAGRPSGQNRFGRLLERVPTDQTAYAERQPSRPRVC